MRPSAPLLVLEIIEPACRTSQGNTALVFEIFMPCSSSNAQRSDRTTPFTSRTAISASPFDWLSPTGDSSNTTSFSASTERTFNASAFSARIEASWSDFKMNLGHGSAANSTAKRFAHQEFCTPLDGKTSE